MSGATAGLNVVCQVLLSPGDELILPTPSWPLARGLATARGAKTVEVPFYTRLGAPDFDPERALRDAVTDRTVAIYVNTPHNPTGVVLDDDVEGRRRWAVPAARGGRRGDRRDERGGEHGRAMRVGLHVVPFERSRPEGGRGSAGSGPAVLAGPSSRLPPGPSPDYS